MIIKKDINKDKDVVYFSDISCRDDYHYLFEVACDGSLYKLGKGHNNDEYYWYSFTSPQYYFGDWLNRKFSSSREAVEVALNHEHVENVYVFQDFDDMIEFIQS